MCIWEFHVAAGQEATFRRAPGYIDTRLLQDPDTPGRYVTVDRWESVEAYRRFRDGFATAYAALDRAGEGLTRRETCLGEFLEVP